MDAWQFFFYLFLQTRVHKYRIMAVMKVGHYHFYLIRRAVILVIMFIETFKTDVIGNSIMCLTSNWPIILGISVSPLTLILTISVNEIKWKMSKLGINENKMLPFGVITRELQYFHSLVRRYTMGNKLFYILYKLWSNLH